MLLGILVPLGHALVPAAVAIGLRANLPAAVFAPFASNSLRTRFIFLAAYHVGSAVLGQAGQQLM